MQTALLLAPIGFCNHPRWCSHSEHIGHARGLSHDRVARGTIGNKRNFKEACSRLRWLLDRAGWRRAIAKAAALSGQPGTPVKCFYPSAVPIGRVYLQANNSSI